MPLNDFACANRHVTEAIRPLGVEWIDCGDCGSAAQRQIPSQIAVVGPTTNIRGMYSRFVEASAELDHNATKYESSRGEAAPLPNLWKASKSHADAVIAAGENPVKRSA